MRRLPTPFLRTLVASLATTILIVLTACSNGGGGNGSSGNTSGTNRARFTFDVDLQGVAGVLVMEVEIVRDTGITWGPGVDPDITGVIATGTYTIFTAGELRSPNAYYVFNGENAFADFTAPATFERFRVQFSEIPQGLRMVVNPFGPGPVAYDCILRSSEAL